MFQSTTQLIITLLLVLPFAVALAFTLFIHFRKPGNTRPTLAKPTNQEAAVKPTDEPLQQLANPNHQSETLREIQDNLTSALSKAIELDRPALALLIADALEEAKHDSDSLKGS